MMKLTDIKGIGEKTAGVFSHLGIYSAEDLIKYFPRDYEKYESPVEIYKLKNGGIYTVEGVLSNDASVNNINGLIIVNAYLSDMTGRLQLSWFNQPYLRQTLKAGLHYVFRGKVYEKNGRLVMNQAKIYRQPDYREKYESHLMPVYGLTKGISNNLLIKTTAEALRLCLKDEDFLSQEMREKYRLMAQSEALTRIHFPRNEEELVKAVQRLSFDELFTFILQGKLLRSLLDNKLSEYRCKPDFRLIKFIADLPFELTKAQQSAYRDIIQDMNSGKIMNRLVEGDVGSGKTIVAVLALLNAAFNGYQAVFMAPTEVLAKQHYATITRLLNEQDIDLSVVLLTGSTSQSEKKHIYEQIKSHEADIIVGTHAVFQEKVEYASLGLVITDEQHRFGVSQREALAKKGNMPHNLIMSATPIPRTLCSILYGGLDISVIDVLPEGRKKIKNCVVNEDYRNTAYKFIFSEIKKKHQAYIICPAIEGGDNEEIPTSKSLENVEEYSIKLKKIMPDEVRIGVLHGKMSANEKTLIMEAFKNNELDILVSTTVIEVGVDVPNATVMMIENADRFGLSQLHQLRGRVGRGDAQSYCIFVNTSESENAGKRLDILNKSNDGFYIAEEDLKLRGPGDLFGIRQSGELDFKVADIYRDKDILMLASKAAEEVLENDPQLSFSEHQGIRKVLDENVKNGYTV
ncbi:MAG: ATP-dependent DNA helicase RecG [Eubacteriales bacterium]|nr:ATP-dependent DNA helicase RecG [Eubacteriales bacterium]